MKDEILGRHRNAHQPTSLVQHSVESHQEQGNQYQA